MNYKLHDISDESLSLVTFLYFIDIWCVSVNSQKYKNNVLFYAIEYNIL
jgi:hypothetical protein